MKAAVLVLLVFLALHVSGSYRSLQVLYRWKTLEFEFPSHSERERMIRYKQYIPGNAVPIDVDAWKNDNDHRVFLTIPRFKDGIPASLVTVSNRKEGESHLLKPYPDWSWHSHAKGCDGLTSVFRTQIDKCGRLWAIDSGMVDLFKSPRRRQCQPQLVAFSLANDGLAGKYRFPDNVLYEGSILTTVAVDVRDEHDRCMDTFVYVADVTGNNIVVYDARRGKSWKVQSNTMYPYPPYGIFQTNNIEFDLMDGVIGLALGPLQNGDRMLYYHSFASVRESWVSTSVLRNESHFVTGFNMAPREFKMSDEARASQAAPEAFDKSGNLYFSPISKNSINCWNHQSPFTRDNIHEIVKDDTNLQFATGLKVIQPENNEEEILVLSTRFQLVMVDRMNKNEVNFRVLAGKIDDLTKDTYCKPQMPIAFPHRPHYHREKPHRRPGYGMFS